MSNSFIRKCVISVLLGIASLLYLVSFFSIWALRITSEKTFVSTFSTIIENQAIKEGLVSVFTDTIATKENEQVLAKVLFNETLTESQLGTFEEKIQIRVEQIVRSVVTSKTFEDSWKLALGQTYSTLFANSSKEQQDKIDIRPVVTSIYDQLQTTELAPAIEGVIPADFGVISLPKEGASLYQRNPAQILETVKLVWLASAIAMVVFVAIAIIISNNKIKTLRSFLITITFSTTVIYASVYVIDWFQERVAKDKTAEAVVEVLTVLLESIKPLALTAIVCTITSIFVLYVAQFASSRLKQHKYRAPTEVPTETITPEPTEIKQLVKAFVPEETVVPTEQPKETVSVVAKAPDNIPVGLPAPIVGPGAPTISKPKSSGRQNLVQ